MSGEQLVALLGRRGVGPVVRQGHVAAEPAIGLLDEFLDLCHRPVRCPDDVEAAVDELDHLVDAAAADRHLRERGEVVEARGPASGPSRSGEDVAPPVRNILTISLVYGARSAGFGRGGPAPGSSRRTAPHPVRRSRMTATTDAPVLVRWAPSPIVADRAGEPSSTSSHSIAGPSISCCTALTTSATWLAPRSSESVRASEGESVTIGVQASGSSES